MSNARKIVDNRDGTSETTTLMGKQLLAEVDTRNAREGWLRFTVAYGSGFSVGDLVTDKNYGRTCVVLATRAKSILVALRQKSSKRTQARWRPLDDVRPVAMQSRSEALGIACAALRSRVTLGRTFRREAPGVGRVDPTLRLMLLRRPFGTPAAK